jgi:hypothetical protein
VARSNRYDGSYEYRGAYYRDGLLYKTVGVPMVAADKVNPTLDELARFEVRTATTADDATRTPPFPSPTHTDTRTHTLTHTHAPDMNTLVFTSACTRMPVHTYPHSLTHSLTHSISLSLSLSHMPWLLTEDKQALQALADAHRRSAPPVVFVRGDHVAVASGELQGLTGRIDSVDGAVAIVTIALERAPAAAESDGDEDEDGGDEGRKKRAAAAANKPAERVYVCWTGSASF